MRPFKINNFRAVNFRNLKDQIIEFGPSINCFWGENSQGKTNILEVINFIFEGKSFKKNCEFSQILNFDQDKTIITINSQIEFQNNSAQTIEVLTGFLTKDNSNWIINNTKQFKKSRKTCFLMTPHSFSLFFSTSKTRREHFDLVFSLLDLNYRRLISRYQKILLHRNKLLSKVLWTKWDTEQFQILNLEMSNLSFEIIHKRKSIIGELNLHLGPYFQKIFSISIQILFEYESRFLNFTKEQIFNFYNANLEKDRNRRTTTSGIHLDDYILKNNGLNSTEHFSFGQLKLSFLSLQLAFIELFMFKNGYIPAILIDDISSELDTKRWLSLIHVLTKYQGQIFLTTTDFNFCELIKEFNGTRLFEVKSGLVTSLR
jgi:DNA replication and repair protein RecF